MKYKVEINRKAELDIKKIIKSGNKIDINKLNKILEELETNPTTGSGKPEQLKHDLNGFWSRRINQKDRLIYAIEDEIVTVIVVSALGHYEN